MSSIQHQRINNDGGNLMLQNFLDLTILSLNVMLLAITGENINLITAILSLLFLIVFRLPKFLYYLSNALKLGKKMKNGQHITRKDIKEIYEDSSDEKEI